MLRRFCKSLLLLLALAMIPVCLFAGPVNFAELSFPKPFQAFGATDEKLSGEYEVRESVETFDGISSKLFYKDDFLPTRFVTAIASNKKGDVFVGTKDVGILRFSLDSSKRHWFKFPQGIEEIAVHDLIYDEKNTDLLAATTGGVFRIKDQTDFFAADFKIEKKFPRSICLAMTLDKDNGLWVGTPNGLFDPSGTHFTASDGLPSDMVNALKADAKGNIWIGTDGGLVKKSANTFQIVDLGSAEKRWINDLDQEAPLELFIPIEKYKTITTAFFAGIRKNPDYGEKKEEIDAQMSRMLNVDKPGSDDILVAASDGLYRIKESSLEVQRLREGWYNALTFANTGQFYAVNNELLMESLSPTTRLIGKFDLGKRLVSKLVGRLRMELNGEEEPDVLDEKTIAELQGEDEETIFQTLESFAKNFRVTDMHIDKEGRLWVATDGGGLYYFVGRLNTANFFVKSLSNSPGEFDQKRRHLLQTEVGLVAEQDDLTLGEASCRDSFAKVMQIPPRIVYPLKIWYGKSSELLDDDWKRIGYYVGRIMKPNDSIAFLGLLAVDPYQFIPCIHLSDIPDLYKTNRRGFADLSEEIIEKYEKYELPTVPVGDALTETYPENHPESLLRPENKALQNSADKAINTRSFND